MLGITNNNTSRGLGNSQRRRHDAALDDEEAARPVRSPPSRPKFSAAAPPGKSCTGLVGNEGAPPDSACVFYSYADCETKHPWVGCVWELPLTPCRR